MLLILFPRLPNGNILWTCDNCNASAEVSCTDTNAVALYCTCNNKINPQCNEEWYNKGLYFNRIPMELRINKNVFLRELYKSDEKENCM